MEEVIIIGAGPCGLSTAIELKKRGLDPLIIEKGCIANSIYGYPTNMQFFSTPELLEIGDVPFIISREKPTRQEALKYYREVAWRKQLRVHTYEKVMRVEDEGGRFEVRTENRYGEKAAYRAKRIVIATGYFDNPNWLRIPGEDLPKVTHYYKEAHPYHGSKVAVIGGNNSAVEAAMELEQAGAEVTMIYRRGDYSKNIKPWVLPVFRSTVEKGRIRVLWNANVTSIEEREITVEQEGRSFRMENDYVLALTGYRPNRKLLTSMGVNVDEETGEPAHDPETMETNVKGIYVSGVIAAGYEANRIFIENGRFHGGRIAEHIASS